MNIVKKICEKVFKVKANYHLLVDTSTGSDCAVKTLWEQDRDGVLKIKHIEKLIPEVTKIKLKKEFKGWSAGSEFRLSQKTKYWCFGVTKDGIYSGPLPLSHCELITGKIS